MKYVELMTAAAKVLWRDKDKIQRLTLAALLIVLLMVVSARIATETQPPMRIEQASFTPEQAIVSEQQEQEAQRALEIAAKEAEEKTEAEEIAKVIYGMARNHASQHQETVVWCILNRVEDNRYPDSVVDVCRQEAQWVGYSEDNPVIESYYQMARRMLTEWRSGAHRPMAPDYVFAERTSDSIILRSTYEITARTRYYEG